jgi:hypothetical protein
LVVAGFAGVGEAIRGRPMRGEARYERGLVLLSSTSRRASRAASAAGDAADERGFGSARHEVFGALRGDRASVHPAGAASARFASASFSIRSARQRRRLERLEFDMLFRWFVGLSIDERVFDASTFSKNRDRLLTHEIAHEFPSSLLGLAEGKGFSSPSIFRSMERC